MSRRRAPPGRWLGRGSGFILLPVVLTLSLIASIAFISNRDSGTNIDMLSGRADTDKARYAAEAGLEHLNYVVQQKSCAGSYPQAAAAPLVVADFGGAGYSAYADRASGSPVQLTATGSYNGATVTLVRRNAIVFQPTPQTFTIQPDTFDGKDTYLSDRNRTTNYGGETTMRLKRDDYDALIRFDLSVLPAGSRPLDRYGSTAASLDPGAQLWLYQTLNVGGATVQSAYLTQVAWTEGSGPSGAAGATWTTSDGSAAWPAGRGYHPAALDAETTTDQAGWKQWSVTDAAAAWLSGALPNNGLWLVASGTKKDVEFFSSEELINISLRPKLTLNYLLPCGAAAPQGATLTPTRDAEIDSSNPLASKATATLMAVSATQVKRALIAFDTSPLIGRSVGSARLRVFLDNASPNAASTALSLTVNALDKTWIESASWNEPLNLSGTPGSVWGAAGGGSFRATASATTTLPQGFREGRWVEFDVASLVQEWVAGTTPNLGVIVRNASSASDELRFATREAGAARAPQLVVTYR